MHGLQKAEQTGGYPDKDTAISRVIRFFVLLSELPAGDADAKEADSSHTVPTTRDERDS